MKAAAKREFLGDFEQLVMLALLRLDANAYGMRVRQEITARTKREVAIGAVYTTLERLEAKSMVSSTTIEAGDGTRAKRVFRPTSRGRRALDASREALASMSDGLNLTGAAWKTN